MISTPLSEDLLELLDLRSEAIPAIGHVIRDSSQRLLNLRCRHRPAAVIVNTMWATSEISAARNREAAANRLTSCPVNVR